MKKYFTVPNIMGYFRILLIPVYLVLYLRAQTTEDYYIAAGVILLSALTDLFDGKIARRFNQVMDFGKILDPVADKLTQGTIAISLTFRYPFMSTLLMVFLIKEFIMASTGLLLMRKGWKTNGAIMAGKISTAILDVTMLILILCPDIKLIIANVLMLVCIVVMIISFMSYVNLYAEVFKNIHKGTKAEEIDMVQLYLSLKNRRKKKMRWIVTGIILAFLYVIIGAIAPYVFHQKMDFDTIKTTDVSKYYSDNKGVDRATVIEDNKDALNERIRLMEQAKERIFMSTFDFCSDDSGMDMLSVLLEAANRGIDVKIFVDGFNSWINMEGNPYFYALS